MRSKIRKNILTRDKNPHKISPMKINEVRDEARRLMNQYGLNNWAFEFSRTKKAFGTCWFYRRKIQVSKGFIPINTREEIIDTILHEIAHALDWKRNKNIGHSESWKVICREIGARPEATYSCVETNAPKPKYKLIHSGTGEIHASYHRKPKWAKSMKSIIINGDLSTKGKMILEQVY